MNNQKLSIIELVEKCRNVHGDKYNYDKVIYKNLQTPIIITCPIHGDFEQRPANHIYSKSGCPKCSGKFRYNKETFAEECTKRHNGKYTYDKVEFVNGKTPVIITCPKHGDFLQRPDMHLQGQGCPKCRLEKLSEIMRKSTEDFIRDAKKIHGDKYDYSKVEYLGKDVPVEIVCSKHGSFWQTPHHHLSEKAGCPKCLMKNQTQLFEKLCFEFKNEEIIFEAGKQIIPWINRQRIDIYFPKYNVGIEYDGKQHFQYVSKFKNENLELIQARDKRKEDLCKQNNCKLFRLKYNYTQSEYIDLINNIKNLIEKYGC